MKKTDRDDIICGVCKELYHISNAHPDWATGIRYAVSVIANKARIPKHKRKWENNWIPKRRKKNAKNVEVPS